MAEAEKTRHAGDRHEGAPRTSPYPMSRLAPVHDLVLAAEQIAKADEMIGNVVGGKLEVIVEQIRRLQDEARGILATARRDLVLHRARCHFERRIGKIYHLYEDGGGEPYFSMLSPEEWGGSGPPHRHLGSYRLEPDQSWRAVEDLPAHGEEGTAARVRRLLAEAVATPLPETAGGTGR